MCDLTQKRRAVWRTLSVMCRNTTWSRPWNKLDGAASRCIHILKDPQKQAWIKPTPLALGKLIWHCFPHVRIVPYFRTHPAKENFGLATLRSIDNILDDRFSISVMMICNICLWRVSVPISAGHILYSVLPISFLPSPFRLARYFSLFLSSLSSSLALVVPFLLFDLKMVSGSVFALAYSLLGKERWLLITNKTLSLLPQWSAELWFIA